MTTITSIRQTVARVLRGIATAVESTILWGGVVWALFRAMLQVTRVLKTVPGSSLWQKAITLSDERHAKLRGDCANAFSHLADVCRKHADHLDRQTNATRAGQTRAQTNLSEAHRQ